jgi:hypothetical protein
MLDRLGNLAGRDVRLPARVTAANARLLAVIRKRSFSVIGRQGLCGLA